MNHYEWVINEFSIGYRYPMSLGAAIQSWSECIADAIDQEVEEGINPLWDTVNQLEEAIAEHFGGSFFQGRYSSKGEQHICCSEHWCSEYWC
jgi:hypothetical protein